ncbi:ankyrin repeat domain-containing protein [Streptomyces viridosporus]|uniref:ankyrin repeat domain-containing protein n=1 Tax=Streptomyces viridosporus TaxID=67581 RepID=UPI0036F51F13
MSDAWGMTPLNWRDPAEVRRRLVTGADPDARLFALRVTPLHEAVTSEAPGDVVDVLVAHGADVDAADAKGATPLWEAVRWGNRSAAEALLRAGADPWRPAIAGRSPGRLGLDGPLADLFAGLPGAPSISVKERDRQTRADALIASYEWAGYWAGLDLAFVADVDEDELIRRLGAEPARCPLTDSLFLGMVEDPHADWADDEDDGEPEYSPMDFDFEAWVARRDGGAVLIGAAASSDSLCARMSVGTRLATVFFNPKGSCYVYCWADGRRVRQSEPADYPADPWPEEWLHRFGHHAHASSHEARALAFMTACTGVRIDEQWLIRAPKRAVPRSRA